MKWIIAVTVFAAVIVELAVGWRNLYRVIPQFCNAVLLVIAGFALVVWLA